MFQVSLKLYRWLFFSVLVLSASCGIQSIPAAKNEVEATVAETINQYKRRADLIPNLVNTVKGYAAHESDTLTSVTEARAKATQSVIDPAKLDPQAMGAFMKNQGELSQALSRLLMVVEKYPYLKADRNFRDLHAQLEGTENRVTVARQRNIEAIQKFNNLITVPPTSWTNSILLKHEKLPQWTVEEGERKQIESAPDVQF